MKKSGNSSAFKKYCQKLVTQYSSGEAREHAYRPALQEYIESFNNKLRVTNEPGKQGKGKKGEAQNKPDFIVARGQAPIGFVEAKDIGVDLDEVGKTDQIDRYCEAYPNLILTDYVEFRRYVKGELRGKAIRIGRTNGSKKSISFNDNGEDQLTQFFEEFLLEDVESVSSPQELASRLAHHTREVKKLVRQELEVEEDSIRLHKLMIAFKKVLLADLDAEKFADMFAQTLAYGFFAARVHYDGKGEFSRRTASSILPKTNPFLRKVFAEFANESLPDSLIGAVDEIVDLLRKTNIQSVLENFGEQGREDPVVHFYESFLGAYDPKLKKEMGVFYTPDSVVSYMVKSLDEILTTKFGRKKGLADDKTLILDPALGTGSYLHKVIEHVHSKVSNGTWDSYVSENLLHRIFGFEILMAPYAVAHLNLGMQLQKTGYQFEKDQRLGVYLTNTLEETAKRSEVLFSDWISEEAEAAAEVKRQKAIMVVLGNPPYSADSQNDGPWIRDLMRGYDQISNKKCANYFECDGKPLGERNPRWLNDDYVKFIRFAHWRIEQTDHGVLAFITNHGFLDNPTFRGMRQSLMKDFDEIYILDVHGSSKKKETSPDGSKDENVFNIQTGVSINFFIRSPNRKKSVQPKVYRGDLFGLRESKYKWLSKNSFSTTTFTQVNAEAPAYLFAKHNRDLQKEYDLGKKVTDIFQTYSVGVVTARDGLTIHPSKEKVWKTVKDLIALSPSEARERFGLGDDTRDWRVDWALKDLKESGPSRESITPILYRPFDTRFTYYTGQSRGFLCMARGDVMKHMLGGNNLALITARSNKSQNMNQFFVANCPSEVKAGESTTGSALFPLYLKDGNKLIPNVSEEIMNWARQFAKQQPELRFFEYCYAVVHSPSYRERYKDLLKMDFPRIQLTADKKVFEKLTKLGRELIDLHLLTSDVLEGGKAIFSQRGSNQIDKVSFHSKSNRIFINSSQYFENVPESAWIFEVGGYQVLEKWLKDRKGTQLGHEDISVYEKIIESVIRTTKVMNEIDSVISTAGGWPLGETNEIPLKKAA